MIKRLKKHIKGIHITTWYILIMAILLRLTYGDLETYIKEIYIPTTDLPLLQLYTTNFILMTFILWQILIIIENNIIKQITKHKKTVERVKEKTY